MLWALRDGALMTVRTTVFWEARARVQRLSFLRFVRAVSGNTVGRAPDPDDHGFKPGPSTAPYGRGAVFGVTKGQDFYIKIVRDMVADSAQLYAVFSDQAALSVLGQHEQVLRPLAHGGIALEPTSNGVLALRAMGPRSWQAFLAAEYEPRKDELLRRAVEDERQSLLAMGRVWRLEHAARVEAVQGAQAESIGSAAARLRSRAESRRTRGSEALRRQQVVADVQLGLESQAVRRQFATHRQDHLRRVEAITREKFEEGSPTALARRIENKALDVYFYKRLSSQGRLQLAACLPNRESLTTGQQIQRALLDFFVATCRPCCERGT